MKVCSLGKGLGLSLEWVLFFCALSFSADSANRKDLYRYGTGSVSSLDLYQKHISPVRGGISCPMHPSCSQYSKAAFLMDSPLIAYLKTTDRLIRCGHDLQYYSKKVREGKLLHYDPPREEKDSGEPFGHAVRHLEKDSPLPGDSAGDDGASILRFPDNLLRKEKYSLALLEYHRIAYNSSNEAITLKAMRRIGHCIYFLESLEPLNLHLTETLRQYPERQDLIDELLLLKSQLLYKQGNFQTSSRSIRHVDSSSRFYQKAQWMRALNAINLLQLDSAKYYIAATPSLQKHHLLNPLEDMTRELQTTPYKSPWIAGTMGTVLPGSGYFYAGRYSTGLAAMMINGLFFWVIGESFYKKHYSIAATSFTLGFGWYVGSIMGSVNAVKKHNGRKTRDVIEKHVKGFTVPLEKQAVLEGGSE